MRTLHYRNLTNGLNCPHYTPDCRYLRLQSTACEQQLWESILLTLRADFYYELASGADIIVHDQSEKPRETRACWQGLSWVRFVTTLSWYEKLIVSPVRSGMDVQRYWFETYCELPKSTRRYVDYFAKYVSSRGFVVLKSCYNKSLPR